MRFMFLNHSAQHHSAELEAHIAKLLKSYSSPDTTFELAYPEDLGGGAVLSLLEERKALSGLHLFETPRWQKPSSEHQGFDAVIKATLTQRRSKPVAVHPVIGLLRASLHFAASICTRFPSYR
jgi:hypothetical protein